jgi:hypothetical protein
MRSEVIADTRISNNSEMSIKQIQTILRGQPRSFFVELFINIENAKCVNQ